MTTDDLDVPVGWLTALGDVTRTPEFHRLATFLLEERDAADVYPTSPDVFAALKLTPLESVRAVILGQDPYHGPGQATGLAFSVAEGCKKPRSLQNILNARERDLGLRRPASGSLERWAENGVLLLNTALTVRRAAPNSHRNRWEAFTDAVISAVVASDRSVAFLLWGRQSQTMPAVIRMRETNRDHHVIVPSLHPVARPHPTEPRFIDSKPFSRANDALCRRDEEPIEWSLPGDQEPGSGGYVPECPSE